MANHPWVGGRPVTASTGRDLQSALSAGALDPTPGHALQKPVFRRIEVGRNGGLVHRAIRNPPPGTSALPHSRRSAEPACLLYSELAGFRPGAPSPAKPRAFMLEAER